MLTQEQANKFAIDNQTTTDNILKEHYQMYLLDVLYKSSFEKFLVFKGGAALKLAYNSIRFSEDLDFSLLKNIPFKDFEKTIKGFINIFPEAKIVDIYDKRNTLFAKITFSINFKTIPIGVKIEINKGVKDFKHAIALLKSPFNNIEVTGRVYTLESILKDKLKIIKNKKRREPRDLFDAWYISQKLGKNFIINNAYKYSKKELMDFLNPLIPKNHSKVMELFEK